MQISRVNKASEEGKLAESPFGTLVFFPRWGFLLNNNSSELLVAGKTGLSELLPMSPQAPRGRRKAMNNILNTTIIMKNKNMAKVTQVAEEGGEEDKEKVVSEVGSQGKAIMQAKRIWNWEFCIVCLYSDLWEFYTAV